MKDKSKVLKTYGYMFDKLQFIEKTGMNKKCFFSFHCARLALSLNKIGGGSAMKIKKCFFFFSLRSPCTIFK